MLELAQEVARLFQDQSFPVALTLADRAGIPPEPEWLDDVSECIRVVQLVQTSAAPGFVQSEPTTVAELEMRMDRAFRHPSTDPASCADVDSPEGRKSILLRLWAGCVWSGKMIALETRSGPTDADLRGWFFREVVDPRTACCHVYRAGVRAAYRWKRFLDQPVNFDGVPEGHLVREIT